MITLNPKSIRARLTLGSVLAQALILTVMGIALWFVVRANLLASVDRELASQTLPASSDWLEDEGPVPMMPPLDILLPAPSHLTGRMRRLMNSSVFRFRPRLLNLQGQAMFAPSADAPWDRHSFRLAVQGKESFSTLRVVDEPIRVFSVPLRRRGVIIGVVQAASSLREVYRDMAGLTRALFALLPLALLVNGLSGAWQIARALRPVRQITQTADRIGAADLSQRLPVIGQDDFAQLSRTFNAMLARLEATFQQQQQFTADASHELRTPLTAIKAHTSLALTGERTPAEYRRALEGADRAATLMTRIVQDLLLLAGLDAERPQWERSPVCLGDVLASATTLIAGMEHAPIQWESSGTDIQIAGDANHLIRLFANLLENSARHTPPDGLISLEVMARRASVTVTVADTGTGIAPEHLPHLGKRFYRSDMARSRKHGGSGLGLAICRSIVEAHEGQMEIESQPGRGTAVRVTFPRPGPTPS